MRHRKRRLRIGTDPSHRKAIFRGLMAQVLEHGRIKTTLAKAKALKAPLEKLITLAKIDTVANRRLAFKKLNNKKALQDLFEVAGEEELRDRPGGYTRLMRLSERRLGDNAPQAFLSLVSFQFNEEPLED